MGQGLPTCMKKEVISRLIDLNHQFYQTFAGDFAATRQRLQPGVMRLVPELVKEPALIDIGCGSGELARQLAKIGFIGQYTGVDFSERLLEIARSRLAEPGIDGPAGRFDFQQVDLAEPGWSVGLQANGYAAATAFAVLHHLPGESLRLRVLADLHGLLAPGGRLHFSVWQFMRSPRLAGRILPWEEAGLAAEDVDEGDALLDWRAGGHGIRYAHQFGEQELVRLASMGGFQVEMVYYSDGKQGDLGLYQVWQRQ